MSRTNDGVDRSTPLLVAAGVVVVATVALVLTFGIERPPSVPDVRDEPSPAPDASVAVRTFRDLPCIDVVSPDGTVREARCDDVGDELLGWGDAGLVISDWRGDQPHVLTIDPDTGEVVTSVPVEPAVLDDHWARGREVRHRHERGQLVVEEPPGQEIWRVDAPEAYGIRSSSVSPDGRWLAVVDSVDRLLVLATDGSAPPRVLATGVDTFRDPVWEGGWHHLDDDASPSR